MTKQRKEKENEYRKESMSTEHIIYKSKQPWDQYKKNKNHVKALHKKILKRSGRFIIAGRSERPTSNLFKKLNELPQVEPQFFNSRWIPWNCSFFSLKEEDMLLFGETLRKKISRKRCFQQLHKNRRRRCMSYNPYRVPLTCKKTIFDEMLISEPKSKQKKKKKRGRKRMLQLKGVLHKSKFFYAYYYKKFIKKAKKKNWLETHLYHAKRFRMISMYGYQLALKNCNKIGRRIFRYSKRKALIHDASYIQFIQLVGKEEEIINLLKTCTNAEEANMLRKKYTSGILSGKFFVYAHEEEKQEEQEPNLFNSKRECLGAVYFLWRTVNKRNMTKQNINMEENRCLWLLVHPLSVKAILNTFHKIKHHIKIQQIRNICMYEMIGPKSFQMLFQILKVRNKYVKKKTKIHKWKYDQVTIPYEFVIPTYAILPRSIGPFLLNYRIQENELQKRDRKDSAFFRDENKENELSNKKKNEIMKDSFTNSFEYLKQKNGRRKLDPSDFSCYDNNILMNEKIKDKVIQHIKVNKYEHIRSNKKKKIRTCIMRIMKESGKEAMELYEKLKDQKHVSVESRKDEEPALSVTNVNANVKEETNEAKGMNYIFQNDIDIKKYIVSLLERKKNVEENSKKKTAVDKEIEQELSHTKEHIKKNVKKYIKIPILIINKSDGENQRVLILCPAKKKSSNLFYLLVRNECIAIGLHEREKVLKNYGFICFPKDFPDTIGGISYNQTREQMAKNNYDKKPVAKRVNYYCLGINDPFNFSWMCIYPYNEKIKVIRITDSFSAFQLITFIRRFLELSLKKLSLIESMEEFKEFINTFKNKFEQFARYFITVYVSAYNRAVPKRLSHICSLNCKETLYSILNRIDTAKMQEWIVHQKIVHPKEKRKEKNNDVIKESIIKKFKNKKRCTPNGIKMNCNLKSDKQETDKKGGTKEEGVNEIILPSKKIIGYFTSGGHVLSKGYGFGIGHISFLYFLESLLNHLFVLKLVSRNIHIQIRARHFPVIALMRNVSSLYYHYVWVELVPVDKFLPF